MKLLSCLAVVLLAAAPCSLGIPAEGAGVKHSKSKSKSKSRSRSGSRDGKPSAHPRKLGKRNIETSKAAVEKFKKLPREKQIMEFSAMNPVQREIFLADVKAFGDKDRYLFDHINNIKLLMDVRKFDEDPKPKRRLSRDSFDELSMEDKIAEFTQYSLHDQIKTVGTLKLDDTNWNEALINILNNRMAAECLKIYSLPEHAHLKYLKMKEPAMQRLMLRAIDDTPHKDFVISKLGLDKEEPEELIEGHPYFKDMEFEEQIAYLDRFHEQIAEESDEIKFKLGLALVKPRVLTAMKHFPRFMAMNFDEKVHYLSHMNSEYIRNSLLEGLGTVRGESFAKAMSNVVDKFSKIDRGDDYEDVNEIVEEPVLNAETFKNVPSIRDDEVPNQRGLPKLSKKKSNSKTKVD